MLHTFSNTLQFYMLSCNFRDQTQGSAQMSQVLYQGTSLFQTAMVRTLPIGVLVEKCFVLILMAWILKKPTCHHCFFSALKKTLMGVHTGALEGTGLSLLQEKGSLLPFAPTPCHSATALLTWAQWRTRERRVFRSQH